MSMTNQGESDLLLLYFNNTPVTLIGDAAGLLGSAVAGSLYVSLHSADPGETGIQTTSELTYTGYARVAVARSGAGWTVSGTTQVANAAVVLFGTMTALGPQTATHFGVGTDLAGGGGKLIGSGQITSPAGGLVINNGIAPQFAAGALVITMD